MDDDGRVLNSVGAILSNIGGTTKKATVKILPDVKPKAPIVHNSKPVSLADCDGFLDWTDMGKLDRMSQPTKYDKIKDSTNRHENTQLGEDSTNNKRSCHENDFPQFADWVDTKRFDDGTGEVAEYFQNEEERLGTIYGGNFIRVRYSSSGNISYHCELCLSEMNARKSLDSHCSGMKHLKKKDIWQKRKISGGGMEASFSAQDTTSTCKVLEDSQELKGSTSWAPNENSRAGPSHEFSQEQGRGDSYSSPIPDRRCGRGYGNFLPNRGIQPYHHGDCGWGRGDLEFSGWDNRGGVQSHRDSYNQPRDDCHLELDSYRLQREYYDHKNGASHNSTAHMEDRDCFRKSSGPPPPPPLLSPARQSEPQHKLAGGPTGALLKKLSECVVKNEDDSELALNILTSLSKSLKEYNIKTGNNKLASLMMDIELKLSMVTTLKVGLQVRGAQGNIMGVASQSQSTVGGHSVVGSPVQRSAVRSESGSFNSSSMSRIENVSTFPAFIQPELPTSSDINRLHPSRFKF